MLWAELPGVVRALFLLYTLDISLKAKFHIIMSPTSFDPHISRGEVGFSKCETTFKWIRTKNFKDKYETATTTVVS